MKFSFPVFFLVLISHQKYFLYDNSLKDTNFSLDKSSEVLSQMRWVRWWSYSLSPAHGPVTHTLLSMVPFPDFQAAFFFQFVLTNFGPHLPDSHSLLLRRHSSTLFCVCQESWPLPSVICLLQIPVLASPRSLHRSTADPDPQASYGLRFHSFWSQGCELCPPFLECHDRNDL